MYAPLEIQIRNNNNMIHFSQYLKIDYPELFSAIAQALEKHGEQYTLIPHTADYWCRDYMPAPTPDGKYLLFRFNPDYLQSKTNRKYISDSKLISNHLKLDYTETDIILDGGNIVRCGNKIVMVDKIFKENPHYKSNELISRLETLLNAQIILLPWDKNEKYGHSDGIVRHIEGNKVLLTNYRDYDPRMHGKFKNLLSQHFEVLELSYTYPNPKDNSWAYINFLQTDKIIILPRLGTNKDQEALAQFETHFHNYKGRIELVDISPILAKGGGLNCISWNSTV